MSIKLTSFMTVYKSKKSIEEKEKYVIDHIKDEYVPYEKKADVAKAIVDSTFYLTDDKSNKKIFHVDSIAKYMLTCMAVVDLYTTIERSKAKGNMLDDFNLLNKTGVLDIIIQNVNQRELKEFNMVLQLTCDDIMTNEYENHAFISKQLERFGDLFTTTLSPVLEQLDLSKIYDAINIVQ